MTRRSAIHMAAWTTPAVLIANNAPAFATSNLKDPPRLKPKGNRSHRHDGHSQRWDYHVDPGTSGVKAVWIGNEPAHYNTKGHRWTREDLPKGADRQQPVHIVVDGHAMWSGMVRFS